MKGEQEEVGRVTAIYRYPVKSMGGEDLPACKLGWHGLAADRRFSFYKPGSRSGFPWLTIRDCPRLALYSARLDNPDEPNNSTVLVRNPEGCEQPVDSPGLIEELEALSGEKVALIQHYGGIYDAMDLSLITIQSIDSLGALLTPSEEATDVRRFRPNIVIDSSGSRAYPEDKWVGETLVLGEGADAARVRASRKDLRCMVVNVSPESGRQNPEYMRTLVRERKNLLGVYGSIERPGLVRVGDPVYLSRG
jgi:uncharacterized protein